MTVAPDVGSRRRRRSREAVWCARWKEKKPVRWREQQPVDCLAEHEKHETQEEERLHANASSVSEHDKVASAPSAVAASSCFFFVAHFHAVESEIELSYVHHTSRRKNGVPVSAMACAVIRVFSASSALADTTVTCAAAAAASADDTFAVSSFAAPV